MSGCRTAGRSPAPGSPRLQGLFGQKRKRGFSKVEEGPKQAGQTRKEQTRARCERPRSLERSQRILSKQQPPRINRVCARGRGRGTQRNPPPGYPGSWRGPGTGGGALRVRKSLQVREWPGVQDKEGWELRVAGGQGDGLQGAPGALAAKPLESVPRWWQT